MKQKIAVLGAGTMGHGIAASFAMGGHQVNLYSRSLESAGKGICQIREDLDVMVRLDYLSEEEEEKAIGRITPCDDLKEAVSDRDYVIESLPENLKLKLEVLEKVDAWCPEHTVLASNTSSFKLDELAKALSPQRGSHFVINHWFNPAHIVPLVELSDYGNNDRDVLDEVYRMHIDLGKQPVYVKKDIPGMLETGELGLKTGKGFYDFRGQDSAEIRAGFNEDMIRQLKLSKEFFMK